MCLRGGNEMRVERRESVLFIGTQFSILYTSMYSPAEAATARIMTRVHGQDPSDCGKTGGDAQESMFCIHPEDTESVR